MRLRKSGTRAKRWGAKPERDARWEGQGGGGKINYNCWLEYLRGWRREEVHAREKKMQPETNIGRERSERKGARQTEK